MALHDRTPWDLRGFALVLANGSLYLKAGNGASPMPLGSKPTYAAFGAEGRGAHGCSLQRGRDAAGGAGREWIMPTRP